MENKELKEKANRLMKDGGIRATMMIEVLAVNEEAAKSSLEKHVEKMEREKGCIVYKKEFQEINRVENPLPRIPVAYSNIVELEMVTVNYDSLMTLVMHYAPSSVEVLEPDKIIVKAGEAQAILSSVSEMMHNFAAQGVGGVVIKT